MNGTATAISTTLKFGEEVVDGRNVVRLEGRIDSSNAAMLTERLQAIVANGAGDLVLDLSALDYLTSGGFRAFLIVSDDLEAKKRDLRLCHVNDDVRELFEMGGMLEVFSVHDNLGEALSQGQ